MSIDIWVVGDKTWYSKEFVDKIANKCQTTLDMVDYRTYFKRDNKSLKQEGFKALHDILGMISEVEK